MRRVILTTGLVLALAVVGWVFLGLYTPSRRGVQYLTWMRRFLTAASAQDSLGLTSMGTSVEATNWGLQVARSNPEILRTLRDSVGGGGGGSNGDSTILSFSGPRGGPCYNNPVVVTFIGSPTAARVVRVTSDCAGLQTSVRK